MLTRRDFVKHATLISLAPSVPAFLAQTARAASPSHDDRILVVIELDGGNDGLNTVIPYADENYTRLRPKLAVPKARVRRLNDALGLNPVMRSAADLFHDGRLAIVQGVGYPNPNKSHDVSKSIWETARFDPTEHTSYGWIGRAMDDGPAPKSSGPGSVLVGPESVPVALRGRKSVAAALANLDDMALLLAIPRRPPGPPRPTPLCWDSFSEARSMLSSQPSACSKPPSRDQPQRPRPRAISQGAWR